MDLFTLLASDPALQVVAIVCGGLIVGSFLNVVIHRLPLRLETEWREQCAAMTDGTAVTAPEKGAASYGLLWPPSSCPHCGHRIRPWENIPVVSWLMLRGRCSGCGERISARYPVVEAVTAVLSLVVLWRFGWTVQTAAALLFTWALVALTAIDLDHMLLPDGITLPLLWLGLLVSVAGWSVAPSTAIIGAIAGYLALWVVYHVFRLLTGKEGMGYGDFKLLAALGAWMGWQSLPLIVILSSAVGAIVGVAMIAGLGRGRDQPIPFGPYLAAAGWIAMLWGDRIIGLYLHLAGLR
ncbi:MAG TPA: A24 family peptidase [Gammaproteobacteria bacterium]|nr:A24 family peptidase [Gammaproteobacteria bacterium]